MTPNNGNIPGAASIVLFTCDCCGDQTPELVYYPPTDGNYCVACIEAAEEHAAVHGDDNDDRN